MKFKKANDNEFDHMLNCIYEFVPQIKNDNILSNDSFYSFEYNFEDHNNYFAIVDNYKNELDDWEEKYASHVRLEGIYPSKHYLICNNNSDYGLFIHSETDKIYRGKGLNTLLRGFSILLSRYITFGGKKISFIGSEIGNHISAYNWSKYKIYPNNFKPSGNKINDINTLKVLTQNKLDKSSYLVCMTSLLSYSDINVYRCITKITKLIFDPYISKTYDIVDDLFYNSKTIYSDYFHNELFFFEC